MELTKPTISISQPYNGIRGLGSHNSAMVKAMALSIDFLLTFLFLQVKGLVLK